MCERWSPDEPAGSTGQQSEAPSAEGLLSALSHPYRRAILRSLGPPDRRTRTPEELVDDVIERRFSSVESSDREELVVVLSHVHLPKLRDVGLVAEDDGRFEFAGYRVVEEILDAVEPYERRR